MLCDRCSNNEATIHLKEVVNGQVTALNLCPDCAVDAAGQGPGGNSGDVDLASLVLGLAAEHAPGPTSKQGGEQADGEAQPCPACGLTAAEFRSTGRLGCAQCYRTFASILVPALADMHRATRHQGKTLDTAQNLAGETRRGRSELPQLEEELARAVAAEAYERAADIRDRLADVRNKTGAGTV